VTKAAVGKLVEQLVQSELRSYVRAHELEENSGTRCFEDASSKRLLRFELGRPKEHLWMIVVEYRDRPNLEALLNRGELTSTLKSIEIGALPISSDWDRERLRRWIAHYASHAQFIDFNDASATRFLDAMTLDPKDVEIASETIRKALSDKVLALRGDVAKSELVLPLGTLLIEQEPGFISSRGRVPNYARLSLDEGRRGSASGWFPVDTIAFIPGFYMSRNAREHLLLGFFDEARSAITHVGEWTLAGSGSGDPLRVDIIRDSDHYALRPAKGYVLHLNRGRSEFIALLEREADGWRAIYEHRDVAHSPLETLERALADAPNLFASYKALADYYAAEDEPARSNLFLGLGYLRVHKLPGVAKAKLNLAQAADPSCDGLTEAFAELEALRDTGAQKQH